MLFWRLPSDDDRRRLVRVLRLDARDDLRPAGQGTTAAVSAAGRGRRGRAAAARAARACGTTCVAVHALVVSPSLARARQNIVNPCVSGELLNVVWPGSLADDAGGDQLGERLVAWRPGIRSRDGPTGPTNDALLTRIAGVVDASSSLLIGAIGTGGVTAGFG